MKNTSEGPLYIICITDPGDACTPVELMPLVIRLSKQECQFV